MSSLVSVISSITGALGLILSGIAGISVVVAFIGIMTTMFTTVVERTKEIGVLKALGYKSSNILSLFLAESAITGLIGGVIGASVGAGLSFVITDVFQALTARISPPVPVPQTVPGLGLGGGGGGFGGGGGGGAFGGGSSSSSSGISALHIVPALSPELVIRGDRSCDRCGSLCRAFASLESIEASPGRGALFAITLHRPSGHQIKRLSYIL